MTKSKMKIAGLEGLSTLSNKDLADKLAAFILQYFEQDEFTLTQRPKVQAVQTPKAAK